jgi:hypothetical protein
VLAQARGLLEGLQDHAVLGRDARQTLAAALAAAN